MTSTKRWLLIAVAALLWQAASGQRLSHTNFSGAQRRLLRQIARYDKMEGARIGRAAMPSEQYARFDSLRRISSPSDLRALTRHASPVVRAYAFSALLKLSDAQLAFEALQTSLRDTAVFYHQVGCIGSLSTVRLFMLVNFRSAVKRGQLRLSAAQRRQFESLDDDLYDNLKIYEAEERLVARRLKDDE